MKLQFWWFNSDMVRDSFDLPASLHRERPTSAPSRQSLSLRGNPVHSVKLNIDLQHPSGSKCNYILVEPQNTKHMFRYVSILYLSRISFVESLAILLSCLRPCWLCWPTPFMLIDTHILPGCVTIPRLNHLKKSAIHTILHCGFLHISPFYIPAKLRKLLYFWLLMLGSWMGSGMCTLASFLTSLDDLIILKAGRKFAFDLPTEQQTLPKHAESRVGPNMVVGWGFPKQRSSPII